MTSSSDKIFVEENNSVKIPIILNGEFFKITKISSNNVDATCCTCKSNYKGFLNATSNFSKHLKVCVSHIFFYS